MEKQSLAWVGEAVVEIVVAVEMLALGEEVAEEGVGVDHDSNYFQLASPPCPRNRTTAFVRAFLAWNWMRNYHHFHLVEAREVERMASKDYHSTHCWPMHVEWV